MTEEKQLKLKGRIIKGVGGRYFVDVANFSDEEILDKDCFGIYECSARGRFRKNGLAPLVGDLAYILCSKDTKKGVVDEILPRKNTVLRPPSANVTQMAVVIAAANPRPSLYLTDKLIASAEAIGINVCICVNKTDLCNGSDLCEIYQKAGYTTIPTCAADGTNIEKLMDCLKDNITVFAGNSGVGKSSILNKVVGYEIFETGEISAKAERGKHTTRHAELVKLKNGGYIIDTPGFGTIDMSTLKPEDCRELFKEFSKYYGGCKFNDCRHVSEPGCSILEAVKNEKIAPSRHESYVRMLKEADGNRY